MRKLPLHSSQNALTLLALIGLMPVARAADQVQILVPAYFYPSSIPAQNQWTEMTSALARGVQITAIMNPANGPGAAQNSDYVAALNAFRGAGGQILGYDYTCYGVNDCSAGLPPTRSVSDVLADAQKYSTWYGVNGIFLDEMSTGVSAEPFYQSVSDSILSKNPGSQIIGNPGTEPASGYFGLANALVTFEGTGADFLDGNYLQTVAAQGHAGDDAAIVHDVASVSEMQTIVADAQADGLGYLYVTDGTAASGNPYETLPSYWNEEVSAFASSVPESDSASLMLAGLFACLFAARNRLASSQRAMRGVRT